jgi:hypothetical protein
MKAAYQILLTCCKSLHDKTIGRLGAYILYQAPTSTLLSCLYTLKAAT